MKREVVGSIEYGGAIQQWNLYGARHDCSARGKGRRSAVNLIWSRIILVGPWRVCVIVWELRVLRDHHCISIILRCLHGGRLYNRVSFLCLEEASSLFMEHTIAPQGPVYEETSSYLHYPRPCLLLPEPKTLRTTRTQWQLQSWQALHPRLPRDRMPVRPYTT